MFINFELDPDTQKVPLDRDLNLQAPEITELRVWAVEAMDPSVIRRLALQPLAKACKRELTIQIGSKSLVNNQADGKKKKKGLAMQSRLDTAGGGLGKVKDEGAEFVFEDVGQAVGDGCGFEFGSVQPDAGKENGFAFEGFGTG